MLPKRRADIPDPRERASYLELPPAFDADWLFRVWAYVHNCLLDQIALVMEGDDDGTRVEITREVAAEAAGINGEAHFSTKFTLKVGMTFKGSVRVARAEHAKDLPRNTELRVDTIARAVGYSDGPCLTRAFPAVFGTTPRDYRRRHSGPRSTP